MLHPAMGAGREGAAQAGEPWLASCQWAPSPLAEFPGVSGTFIAHERNEGDSASGRQGLCLRWCEEKEAHVSATQS